MIFYNCVKNVAKIISYYIENVYLIIYIFKIKIFDLQLLQIFLYPTLQKVEDYIVYVREDAKFKKKTQSYQKHLL